jgi:hypothetical protein
MGEIMMRFRTVTSRNLSGSKSRTCDLSGTMHLQEFHGLPSHVP